MANRQGNNGNSERLFLGGTKITADGDYKMLVPWKESYDQHIKKQRHYFTNKIHLVKAMVFPVIMYGCES